MYRKLKKLSAHSRERGNRNDPGTGESLMAIDALCGSRGAAHSGTPHESRANPALGMVGGFDEVSRSVLPPGGSRGTFALAHGSGDRTTWIGLGDRKDHPAVRGPR